MVLKAVRGILENVEEPVAVPTDKVDVFFLDHPEITYYNWKEFDPLKRPSVKVMIIAEDTNAGIIKEKLLSQDYKAENVQIFSGLKEAQDALSKTGTLPELIVFQGAHEAWQDEDWYKFVKELETKKGVVFSWVWVQVVLPMILDIYCRMWKPNLEHSLHFKNPF